MIKYFETENRHKLDLFINNWIDDYNNDKRKLRIVNLVIIPVNEVTASKVLGASGGPEVVTRWCAWLCYNVSYQ